MAKVNVKKGDVVMIIAGKDKGKSGEVISVNPDTKRIIIDKANIISKHVKPKSAQQAGGIVKQAGSIDSSNVMMICPACEKIVRVSHKINEDNKKVRVCCKCSASLDEKKVAKAAKKTAKKATKKATKKKDSEAKA